MVERWIPGANIRRDAFGLVDVLALPPGGPVLGIQCGTLSGHSAHLKKALAEPRLAAWLLAGACFEIWSWGKRRSRELTKAGKRALRGSWEVRVQRLTLADLVLR